MFEVHVKNITLENALDLISSTLKGYEVKVVSDTVCHVRRRRFGILPGKLVSIRAFEHGSLIGFEIVEGPSFSSARAIKSAAQAEFGGTNQTPAEIAKSSHERIRMKKALHPVARTVWERLCDDFQKQKLRANPGADVIREKMRKRKKGRKGGEGGAEGGDSVSMRENA